MKNKLRLLLPFILLFVSVLCDAKEPSVSLVLSSDMEFYKEVARGFKSYFSDKGTTVKISEYSLKSADAAGIFTKINQEAPDMILAVGEDALKSAKEQTKGVPIVFTMVFNAKIAPDENITGILLDFSPEMKLAGIKKVLPNSKNMGMLYSPNSTASYAEIKAECEKRGMGLNAKIVSSDADFTNALTSAFSGSDCFLVILDPKVYFSQTLKFLLLESIKSKVPVIGLSLFYTKAGALTSFDCDYNDLGKQSGDIAVKIFAGEKASSMKPARPRKYKYSLNLITAEKLGVTIPANVIKEASEVIQ